MVKSSSSTRFFGMENPMRHYVPLWVIVIFLFFVVVLCTMGGLQEGLAKRQLPDTKVNGDLEVTGQIDNDGTRTKTYRLVIGPQAAASADNDSLGLIATGFRTGHFVLEGTVEIPVALVGNAGNLTLGIGTLAQAAFDGTGGTNVGGLTLTAGTNAIVNPSVQVSNGTANAFTDANNSLSLKAATANATQITAGRSIIVTVTVMAGEGAPDLP